ncbi:MAG: hypothetical protein GKR90_26845 [Pseudomonadales bacterium]|nr:hypothetical protein [Pseudomonadales bacterium]
MAVEFELSIPSGSKENLRGTGRYASGVRWIAAKQFGAGPRPWLVRSSVGYEHNATREGKELANYALSLEHTPAFVPASFSLEVDGRNDEHNATVGMKFRPVRSLIFHAGFQVPLNDEGLRPRSTVFLGVEWNRI